MFHVKHSLAENRPIACCESQHAMFHVKHSASMGLSAGLGLMRLPAFRERHCRPKSTVCTRKAYFWGDNAHECAKGAAAGRFGFVYNRRMDEDARILIIEDDADINEVMAAFLTKRGYACTQAFSGSEARWVLGAARQEASRQAIDSQVAAQQEATGSRNAAAGTFDLVITDLMLPGVSGEDIVRDIRQHSDAPIIVVSARAEAHDKVELLKLGADDYLAKPFDLEELHARIIVQLRHAARSTSPAAGEAADTGAQTAQLRYKDWVVNPEARTLIAAGQPVKLTRLEFNIIETLVRRPKKVFTKQELFETAWSEACFVEEKVINVHVSNIRTKLKPSGTDGYIQTVWGIGFKLAE